MFGIGPRVGTGNGKILDTEISQSNRISYVQQRVLFVWSELRVLFIDSLRDKESLTLRTQFDLPILVLDQDLEESR